MNVWQGIMAVGLSASCIGSLVMWWRARRDYAQRHFMLRPGREPFAVKFGWIAAAATIAEALVLHGGGFWS